MCVMVWKLPHSSLPVKQNGYYEVPNGYKLVHIGNTTYVNFVNTFVGCLVE